jgi:hypothetical protein
VYRPQPVKALFISLFVSISFVGAAHAQVDGGAPPDDGGGASIDALPPPGDLGPSDAGDAGTTDAGAPGPEVKAGFTGIVGKVTDGKTNEALIEANVKVVKGPLLKSTLTDIDGNYKLKLPPGEYEIRCWYEVYKPRRIGNVIVEKGKATRLDIQLGADAKAILTVVVEAKLDKRSSEALLQDRKRAVVVQDSISAQEIARSPDTSASEAVKRVPSATIRDGKYIFIRGLGGRYSSVLLNRTEMPSPEPDEPSVPLDMFPTALLSNLNISKTYSPDLPGNFSGGALVIETNSYPVKFEAKLKLTLGYNSEATFRRIQSYDGGNADFLGYDDGTRQLPGGVPNNAPVQNPPLTDSAITEIGRSFKNIWSPRTRLGIPPLGISASIGATKKLKGSNKFGWLAAVNYSYRDGARRGDIALPLAAADPEGPINGREQSTYELGQQSAQLGALLNLGLSLQNVNATHDINLFAFYTHNADNEALLVNGFSGDTQRDFEASRLRFIERDLFFTQVKGDHRFNRAHDFELSWQGNFAVTTRSEPDTRDVVHDVDPTIPGGRRWRDEPQSGERFFSKLREYSGGGALHFLLPWEKFKLRWGLVAQTQQRTFDARRFRMDRIGNNFDFLHEPGEQLFRADRLGTEFQLLEVTSFYDSYTGSLTVGGGYVAGEINAPEALRIVLGARYEVSQQVLTPGSIFAPDPRENKFVNRLEHDAIPSFNLIYALNKRMNLRTAYSYTLARPRLRELAPFFYYDFQRRRSIAGRTDLATTHIHNADLRWEWFLFDGGLVAASVFYKYFDKPIEQVIFDLNASVTFANSGEAHLAGGELEARSHFGFIHKKLRDFYGAFNMALIWSTVTIGVDGQLSAGRTRALQGQSPWVFNVTLGYQNEKKGTEVSVLYNVYGPRIIEVGFQAGATGEAIPDVLEQPQHRLDFTLSQRLHKQVKLKVSAANLAYQPIRYLAGSLAVFSYQPGVNVQAALEWTPN